MTVQSISRIQASNSKDDQSMGASSPAAAATQFQQLLARARSDNANNSESIKLVGGAPSFTSGSNLPKPAAGSALAEAETLSQNWSAWGMHNGVDFANPPSSLPDNAKQTLQFFANNPTLFSAIVQDAGGKSGDPMTLGALNQYISDAQSDEKLSLSSVPSGTPSNDVITNVQSLIANWRTWGLHQGIDFSNPPSDLPNDAKSTLKFISSDPALMAAIGNGSGAGSITEKDAANFLQKASSDASLAKTPSGTPANAVVSNVQSLVENWHAWGMDKGIDFGNPPFDLPADAKKTLNFIASDPAVLNAIGNGSGKGAITEQDAANFLQKAAGDARAAAKAYSDWASANPNAGAQSQALAKSASEILSNATLISGGTGKITADELKKFASSNTNLDPSLWEAAQTWSQPGMFQMLGYGGTNLATEHPGQTINANNISSWISKAAPKNDVQFADMLNQAALENTVAGVDTSKLTGDVLANPQNYSGAQKAAVMVQLGNLQTQMAAGYTEGYWTPGMSQDAETMAGINSNYSKTSANLQNAIDQLSADPDVKAYIAETKPGALQGIISSDPNIQSAVSDFYGHSFITGKALNDDLNAKDSDGAQVTPTQGLETFMQQANFYDEAMGENGKSLGIMNPQANGGPSLVQQVVQQSGQEQNLENAYMDQVVNGKLLDNEIAKGTDLGAAIGDYSQAAAAYGTALDPTFVQNNLGALRQNFLTNVTDAIMNSGSYTDLKSAFGDSKGNFDNGKATQILQQLQKQDPDLFKTSDGQSLPPDKIAGLAKQIFDLVRNGTKMQDAFSKVMSSVSPPSGSAAEGYKWGALHLLSALMGGGVLAAKAAENGGSPTAGASIAATAAQTVGTLTEGVAKWAGEASKTLWRNEAGEAEVPDSVKSTLKQIESEGKVLGGLGGALGGALSIVSGVGDLKNGDVAAGALNIGAGAAGALAGVASATEGGAALLSSAGMLSGDIAGGVAAASGAIGLAAGVVGVAGGLGYLIYELVKGAENNQKFTDQILPVLQQYGITGGPLQPGDYSEYGPNAFSAPPH